MNSNRKIIQICTAVRTVGEYNLLTVLCDDGTVWQKARKEHDWSEISTEFFRGEVPVSLDES